ncbi:hypothetical protein GT360_19580 [Vibrio astriarenae]|uniref:Lipoprotein n=1 Tax=Vibrio astriarenae TaxID=1481923 RepID=A0A7Z2T7M4_9VIBR|nr:hypothetical protein [Vibrio astriarenae]QIA65723.1 hypothetical protein GT360_19580 [Vibrio astriarenae]
MNEKLILVLMCISLTSCGIVQRTWNNQQLPSTQAEVTNSYTYVPLEPINVTYIVNESTNTNQKEKNEKLLKLLPDNSVRISTRQTSQSLDGSIPTIGLGVGVEGNSYEVVIDYINSMTYPVNLYGKWFVDVPPQTVMRNRCYPYEREIGDIIAKDKNEIWSLKAVNEGDAADFQANASRIVKEDLNCGIVSDGTFKTVFRSPSVSEIKRANVEPSVFSIPVYIGIGIRLKANINVLKGSVELGNLSALSLAAQNGEVSGSMSVQTLGINGSSIRSSLLFLSKLDETTIQNAIQAMSSIKADIAKEDTSLTPRLIGYQNLLGADSHGIRTVSSLLTQSNINLPIKQ